MSVAPLAFPDHGATLTIHRGALAENWQLLRDRARARNPGAECAAVVKADAYGCGIAQMVPALEKAGCRTFFVAHLSEAVRLRSVSPSSTVYVLNGLPPGSAAHYRTLDARPVIGSRDEAEEWRATGGGACALHIDTGMNRLGVSAADLADESVISVLRALKPALVMTHFTASEDAADAMTAKQIAAFAVVRDLFSGVPGSLLNSSGHFLPDAPAHDLTRPGYALYGGNPTPGHANPMQPVVGLQARIVQIRDVPDGAKAGYNSLWTAHGARRLATISVGYADGYPRNAGGTDLSSGGYGLIDGVRCPFVGTVSMDLIILDVTDAPSSAVARGAPITLIGGELSLENVGAGARTIGYEMLTSLGRRYRRIYVD
ncbi:MAG: alanine racemase [Beijerinckiaceae bacterium]